MKVLSFSSIRSDFDLLAPLYKLFVADQTIDFKLLICGAHCSPTFGSTFEFIKQQGFPILAKLESLLDSDSPSSRIKSASIMLISAIDIIASWEPDLIIVTGDREDCLMGSIIGNYLSIPVLHFYGGDHASDGHVDNPVRHAVSKLSTAHFVTHSEHKRRLIAIGEEDHRIHVIGNISLDRFRHLPIVSSEEKLLATRKTALVIYHPLGNNVEPATQAISNILDALMQNGYDCHVSSPNSDHGNRDVISTLATYVRNYPNQIFSFISLSNDKFVQLFSKCDVLIGNSSAGILEAASLRKPVINVGLRQTGRLAPENVIFTDTSKKNILKSLDLVDTSEFKQRCSIINNPYGDGQSAPRALSLIKSLDFSAMLRKTSDPLDLLK